MSNRFSAGSLALALMVNEGDGFYSWVSGGPFTRIENDADGSAVTVNQSGSLYTFSRDRFGNASPVVQRDYVCQIHSVQHIELRALEQGYLQDILVDEGEQVREGQVMFRIRPVLYQAEVQRAQAEAEFARIEYRNTQVLADSNVVSPNELALAKARYDTIMTGLKLRQAAGQLQPQDVNAVDALLAR